MIFAYLTPDTFIPISSAGAMIFGGLLAFWPKVKLVTAKTWRVITRQPSPPAPPAAATETGPVENVESPPGV
jgi:hypothetical protein